MNVVGIILPSCSIDKWKSKAVSFMKGLEPDHGDCTSQILALHSLRELGTEGRVKKGKGNETFVIMVPIHPSSSVRGV